MSSTAGESRGTVNDEVTGEHTLNKGFTFRSAFALAFADVSPIVALYAIFTLALFSAGPAFFWAFPVVLAGQLLVAAVFGELASRFPFAGSVYQWARPGHAVGLVRGVGVHLGPDDRALDALLRRRRISAGDLRRPEPERVADHRRRPAHHRRWHPDKHGRPQRPQDDGTGEHHRRGARLDRIGHGAIAFLSGQPG